MQSTANLLPFLDLGKIDFLKSSLLPKQHFFLRQQEILLFQLPSATHFLLSLNHTFWRNRVSVKHARVEKKLQIRAVSG